MSREPIPEDINRFILLGIPSIPYLEAILLLKEDPAQAWDSRQLSKRLYLSDRDAGALLVALNESGIASRVEGGDSAFRYAPITDVLRDLLDRLASIYPGNLIEVTHLVHSKTNKRARQFADAFKLRKES